MVSGVIFHNVAVVAGKMHESIAVLTFLQLDFDDDEIGGWFFVCHRNPCVTEVFAALGGVPPELVFMQKDLFQLWEYQLDLITFPVQGIGKVPAQCLSNLTKEG